MLFVYMDDTGDNQHVGYSALLIDDPLWNASFNAVKELRKKLKTDHGIYLSKELHAWKFVSGRGRPSSRGISIKQRIDIFNEILRFVSQLPNVKLINAHAKRQQKGRLYERLLVRIHRTADSEEKNAIIITDVGGEFIYRKIYRRLKVYNPVASKFGTWSNGKTWKNIPLHRLLEDPFFKDSQSSYFIQLCDFCAYALHRHEVHLESKNKLGLHESFRILEPVLFKKAYGKDRFGIIRAN